MLWHFQLKKEKKKKIENNKFMDCGWKYWVEIKNAFTFREKFQHKMRLFDFIALVDGKSAGWYSRGKSTTFYFFLIAVHIFLFIY